MPKFRKKPVVIEAIQLLDTPQSIREVEEFIDGRKVDTSSEASFAAWDTYMRQLNHTGGRIIHTLEGDHLARFGDFVIKGVKGEFYPCKPDIFEATYEPVLDTEDA
jgi:hypothetical protein